MLSRLIITEATGFDAIADALGYAMIGGGIAFFGLLYFSWRASMTSLRRGALLLGIGAMLLIGLLFWRSRQSPVTGERSASPVAPRPRTTAQPHSVASPFDNGSVSAAADRSSPSDEAASVVGYGFVQVPFSASGLRLLFYADAAYDSSPVDSLVYDDSATGFRLHYAPPDFAPFNLKPDYQRLFLRMTGVSPNRIEVMFNEQVDKRYWVDRATVKAAFWPDFLSGIFSVEPLAAEDFPLRERPLDHASPLRIDPTQMILLPRLVRGDWIRVMISPDGATPTSRFAWLRWRYGERLLVRWSYAL